MNHSVHCISYIILDVPNIGRLITILFEGVWVLIGSAKDIYIGTSDSPTLSKFNPWIDLDGMVWFDSVQFVHIYLPMQDGTSEVRHRSHQTNASPVNLSYCVISFESKNTDLNSTLFKLFKQDKIKQGAVHDIKLITRTIQIILNTGLLEYCLL